MKAVDVPVGKDFQLGDGRRYCRVLFEDSPTVIYRCGVNIAALDQNKNVRFISVNKEVCREEIELEEKRLMKYNISMFDIIISICLLLIIVSVAVFKYEQYENKLHFNSIKYHQEMVITSGIYEGHQCIVEGWESSLFGNIKVTLDDGKVVNIHYTRLRHNDQLENH